MEESVFMGAKAPGRSSAGRFSGNENVFYSSPCTRITRISSGSTHWK